MSAIAIMPCLDLKDGRVVKGVQFVNLIDAGDPLEVARAYAADGARELVMLDITATVEKRKAALHSLEQVASQLPELRITYGGGIASVTDARSAIDAGATRVSVSSAAVRKPALIAELAGALGTERLVLALDVQESPSLPSGYEVLINGGQTATGIDLVTFAREAEQLGAGMLLPTSKTADGAKQGYDTRLIRLLKEQTALPVVASGGAGSLEHFLQAARAGADFLLAASVFHFGQIRISELRRYLEEHGFSVL